MMHEVLAKAANMMDEQPGFYQDIPGRRDPNSICVVIAIMDAANSFAANKVYYRKVADYLGLKYENPDSNQSDGPADALIKWNDTPGRTKEEVVRVLREVAALD